MKAKRPISSTLARMALVAGEPKSRARRTVAIHPAQDGQLPRFDTEDDLERQRMSVDLDDLKWLLEEIQVSPEHPVSPELLLGMPQSERLKKFTCGYARVPGRIDPAPLSRRQINGLLAKAKNYIEQVIVNYEPIEISLQGQRRINWFPEKSTWLAPDRPPPGRFIEATTIASLPAAFLMRLAGLVVRYGQLIQHCAEPSCERLFVKIKRQEYCSKLCSQRARNDKFRDAPGYHQRIHGYYLTQKERKARQTAAK